MSCCDDDLTCVKTEGLQLRYIFPDTGSQAVDLTGYTGQIRIAASEGATVLLSASATVTTNVVAFSIAPATLQTLPNGSPVSEPWVGVFEVDITSPASRVTRVQHGAIIVEKGV